MKPVLVWDLPTRLGHWMLALSFVIAWITGENEDWQPLHIAAGSVMAALVLFRLVWGGLGTRHARFANFIAGPKKAFQYLQSLLGSTPQHYAGHNPAGGYAILALLGLGLLAPITGLLAFVETSGEVMEEVHESITAIFMLVVCLHLLGVLIGSLVHRENLARAMLTGTKLGNDGDACEGQRPLAAVLLVVLAIVAVIISTLLQQ